MAETDAKRAIECLDALLDRGRSLLRELEVFEEHIQATISPKDKRYYDLNSKALHKRVTQEVQRLQKVSGVRCNAKLEMG